MSIQLLATILLTLRLTSIIFISMVLWRQCKLFGTKINFDAFPELTKTQKKNIYGMRIVLFVLASVILLGNIIPVAIDSVALLTEAISNPILKHLGVLYAISNAVTSVVSAFMIWFLYKLAGFGNKK